jgi:glycerol-3-phosphate acyltransferase PlsY
MVEASDLLLVFFAFWLGAIPFSVLIGQLFLGKDIRRYGDGNPGCGNVFRAGGRKWGSVALILDIAKGITFVLLARVLNAPDVMILAVGFSAILGHAFSPFLRMRGGKSVAVTFGVLVALPQQDIFITFALLMLFGFLFVESDTWTTMLGPTGTLVYLFITSAGAWQLLFMLSVLVLFTIKQFSGLRTAPRFKIKPATWLQTRGREG